MLRSRIAARIAVAAVASLAIAVLAAGPAAADKDIHRTPNQQTWSTAS